MYGTVVRQARRARGLTQVELAEITGIEQTNISAIENDRRLPTAATLHQLLLGCGFELVAAAGDTIISLPASPDDVAPDAAVAAPDSNMTMDTRVRMLVGALDAAEAIVRRALMEFVELIVATHNALESADVRHAFGGALALGYVAIPRGTVDVDVNVFIPPPEIGRVAVALAPLGYAIGSEDVLPIAGVRFVHAVDPFPIDVFASLDERYEEIASRVVNYPFGRNDDVLPFLSAEDLALFKLSFARPQDWVDLTAIAKARPDLDVDYIERQLVGLRGPPMYPRVARLRGLLRQ